MAQVRQAKPSQQHQHNLEHDRRHAGCARRGTGDISGEYAGMPELSSANQGNNICEHYGAMLDRFAGKYYSSRW